MVVSRLANSAYLSEALVEELEGCRVSEAEEEDPRLEAAPVKAPKSSAGHEETTANMQ